MPAGQRQQAGWPSGDCHRMGKAFGIWADLPGSEGGQAPHHLQQQVHEHVQVCKCQIVETSNISKLPGILVRTSGFPISLSALEQAQEVKTAVRGTVVALWSSR